MDGGFIMLSDKRLWYAVGAVIVVILIVYYGRFFGGEAEMAPTQ